MFEVLRRVAVTSRCGRRIFGGLTKDLPEKGDGRGIQYVAWWSVMSWGRAGVAGVVPAPAARVPVAAWRFTVRAGGRGADRVRAGGVAAVPEPGAGVPAGARHGLPGPGGRQGR